jgi:hypothetical protein
MEEAQWDQEHCPPGYTPIYDYMVRIEGRDGWLTHSTELSPGRVQDGLIRKGHRPLEVRLLFQGHMRIGEALESQHCFLSHLAQFNGWYWEEKSRCWRAPGEPVLEPPGEPQEVDDLGFLLGDPRCGWLTLRLRVGDIETAIQASDVFDPLEDLLSFSHTIARSGSSHLHIDEEGNYHEFFTFARDDRRVRLVVEAFRDRLSEGDEEEAAPVRLIDALVPRQPLAEILREGVRSYLSLSREQRQEWCNRGEPDQGRRTVEDYDRWIREALQRYATGSSW